MKIFFFDLETTGISCTRHGIHQVSFDIVIDGKTKESANLRVRPHPAAVIEQAALDIAGVTKEQILSYPDMKEGYEKLIETLSKYVDRYNRSDKFFLAGYNNSAFDNQFLRAFFTQNGDKYFGSWFWSNSIDIMVLATEYLLEKRSNMEDFYFKERKTHRSLACGM